MDLEQNRGVLIVSWFMSENGDVAARMEAMDNTSARRDTNPQAFLTNKNAMPGRF